MVNAQVQKSSTESVQCISLRSYSITLQLQVYMGTTLPGLLLHTATISVCVMCFKFSVLFPKSVHGPQNQHYSDGMLPVNSKYSQTWVETIPGGAVENIRKTWFHFVPSSVPPLHPSAHSLLHPLLHSTTALTV
jgi:hypothetical protein